MVVSMGTRVRPGYQKDFARRVRNSFKRGLSTHSFGLEPESLFQLFREFFETLRTLHLREKLKSRGATGLTPYKFHAERIAGRQPADQGTRVSPTRECTLHEHRPTSDCRTALDSEKHGFREKASGPLRQGLSPMIRRANRQACPLKNNAGRF